MIFPSDAEIKSKHPDGNTFVYTTAIPFDHETAVTLADRFAGEDHFILLESAASSPNARYSIIGYDPLWIFRSEGNTSSVETIGKRKKTLKGDNPVYALRQLMDGHRIVPVYPVGTRLGGPDIAKMAGSVGFFSYDIASALEPSVGAPPPKQLGTPDACFFLPKIMLVMDHLSRRLFISRIVLGDDDDVTGIAKKDLEALLRTLSVPHVPPVLKITDAPPDYESCTASFDFKTFKECGERCLEEIKAGEIFQIQIGNRLSCATGARPFDIFRHLRTLNPSPYMFYFRFGKHHILGASPEMMVGVDGKKLTHRPIAGTRRRVWNHDFDRRMREELITSEKERAEHVMLVDLSRNDIGRLAAPGSVKVEELMNVEEYSHVFHMVSQVTGMLKDGADAYDAMVVSFPNGTVSGAPKIRAMQLISEMESVAREFYAGSLGLFDFSGNLRSTILIRTIHVADGLASTQASAGFVYDSIPEQEWQETRNKMAACLLAMQNTQ